jgi:hypothetical protein
MPAPIVTSWTSSGVPVEVSTTQNPGESVEDWVARHFARVRAKMSSQPPDGS